MFFTIFYLLFDTKFLYVGYTFLLLIMRNFELYADEYCHSLKTSILV